MMRRDDRGATAVEYGLMVAAIAAVVMVAVFGFGGAVSTYFSSTSVCISAQASAPCK